MPGLNIGRKSVAEESKSRMRFATMLASYGSKTKK